MSKKKAEMRAALSRAAAKSSAKRKTEKPVQVDDPELYALVTDFVVKKRLVGEAETAAATARLAVLGPALVARTEEMKRRNEFCSSIHLLGPEPREDTARPKVTVTVPNSYGSIPANEAYRLDLIREIVGEDFDRYFELQTTLVLRPAVGQDERKLHELLELIGLAKFEEFFELRESWGVTEQYHRERELDLSPKRRAALDALLPPPTPRVS